MTYGKLALILGLVLLAFILVPLIWAGIKLLVGILTIAVFVAAGVWVVRNR